MKAWNLLKLSENPVLSEVNDPQLWDNNHIMADISHSALNHRDVWIIKGKYPSIKLPCVLGSDASVLTGSGKYIINPGLEWGDEESFQSDSFHILGMPGQGTFAEKIVVPENSLFEVPDHLTMAEAAAIPLAGVTAYRALIKRAGAKQGDKVLITGAGGGVSLWAVQFALALGCEVYVTSGKEAKIEKALALGVAGGVCTIENDWHKSLLQKSGGFDIIIDSIMGNTFPQLIKICNAGAKICFYGASAGNTQDFSPHIIFWRQISLLGSTMGSPEDFSEMMAFIKQNKIKPVIDRVYSFSQLPDALERMQTSAQFGKIILEH
ncbi:MAG: zinc-binding dehydrogenase [Saprospiraceae bacterium]|nr:zinc-binding dehydrogenase [Saprospiraceae bacterium]